MLKYGMKQNILVILTSFFYVTIPALLISLGVGLLTGKYFSTFFVSFGIVFLIGMISNNIIQSKQLQFIKQLEFKKKDLEHQQSVEVSCTSCKKRNVVPVKLNQRNTFQCQQCKVSNLIVFQFTTAAITEPIQLPQIGANTHG